MKYSIDLISDMIPVLRPSDSGGKALTLMEVFKVSHLPVVDKMNYIGLISENNILDMNDPDIPISKYKPEIKGTFLFSQVPIFEVLKQAAEYSISIIAVVEKDSKYIGAITVSDMLLRFVEDSSLNMQGGVIVLNMGIKDYSLSHIGQIVESNDAKILCSYVIPLPETSQLEVVVKVNTDDLTSIIQTFNRYSYNVARVFNASDEMQDELDDRYNQLMKYLDF